VKRTSGAKLAKDKRSRIERAKIGERRQRAGEVEIVDTYGNKAEKKTMKAEKGREKRNPSPMRMGGRKIEKKGGIAFWKGQVS